MAKLIEYHAWNLNEDPNCESQPLSVNTGYGMEYAAELAALLMDQDSGCAISEGIVDYGERLKVRIKNTETGDQEDFELTAELEVIWYVN